MTFENDSQPDGFSEAKSIDRRGALGTLSLAGLGLVATSGSAEAFIFPKKKSIPKVNVPVSMKSGRSVLSGLPDEWTRKNGSKADEYYRYLSRLGLRRVDPAQVIEAHAKKKGSVWNTIPPKAWWKRMGYTLKIAERIAMEMKVSRVEVVSAYRHPAYNARCAGAKSGSWHQANAAVDIKLPVSAYRVTAMARELRNLGLFRGGVGGYRSFTHVDCRGQNVDW